MPDFPALAVTQPNAMTNLGTLMGVAQGAQNLQLQRQALQQKGLELQQSTMDLEERNNLRGLSQNLNKYVGEDGNLDGVNLLKDATTISPKYGAEFAKQFAASHVEATAAKQAVLALDETKRAAVAKALSATGGMKEEQVGPFLDLIAKQNPNLAPLINISKQHLAQTSGNPQQRMEMATRIGESILSLPEQAGVETGQRVGTGQEAVQVSPRAAQPATAPVQMELPPTTPVYGPGNVPSYLGPKPSAKPGQAGFPRETPEQNAKGREGQLRTLNAELEQEGKALAAAKTPEDRQLAEGNIASIKKEIARAGGAALQAGPSPMVAGSQATQIGAMTSDYTDNAMKASSAAQNIGVLHSIKELAGKAITGAEADWRSRVVGLASLLGIDKAMADKTATDLLLKQTAMLVQGAGHTDAERMLVTALTPNNHMTEEAIKHAADIVISQQKLPLIRQEYLQRHITDPAKYNEAMAEFNQNADPRILQFKSMTKVERDALHKTMSAPEWKAFTDKGKWFEKNGLYK